MAMVIGSADAQSGMSKEIFEQMDILLSPALLEAVDAAAGDAKVKAQEALEAAREGWKQLAFAVATGVVMHLTRNVEISGIQTTGDVAANVAGQAVPAPPGPHTHQISLTATQQGVTFNQSGNVNGHLK
ncbi:hypothetical protein [Arthrobacter humicola]|uniref:hypothetical protein n=1 Tax=Arthrobacter humicola TaxID=409291 RepID=UPI001FACA7A3|nr:hypothetical protein [Arthrobacter humicola]MCI9870544.1 hypothetical protein [Arthrobacter humicola]